MYRTCVQPPNEKRLSLLVFLGPPFEVVCTHKKNIYIYRLLLVAPMHLWGIHIYIYHIFYVSYVGASPKREKAGLLVFLGPRRMKFVCTHKKNIYIIHTCRYMCDIHMYIYIRYRTWVHPPNAKRLSLLVFLGPHLEGVSTNNINKHTDLY